MHSLYKSIWVSKVAEHELDNFVFRLKCNNYVNFCNFFVLFVQNLWEISYFFLEWRNYVTFFILHATCFKVFWSVRQLFILIQYLHVFDTMLYFNVEIHYYLYFNGKSDEKNRTN